MRLYRGAAGSCGCALAVMSGVRESQELMTGEKPASASLVRCQAPLSGNDETNTRLIQISPSLIFNRRWTIWGALATSPNPKPTRPFCSFTDGHCERESAATHRLQCGTAEEKCVLAARLVSFKHPHAAQDRTGGRLQSEVRRWRHFPHCRAGERWRGLGNVTRASMENGWDDIHTEG